MRRLFIIIYLVTGLSGTYARSTDADNLLFSKANSLLNSGDYEQALKLYDQLNAHTASAALYNNIGNTYFKQTKYSLAVAWYTKASQLAPLDTQLQFNSNLARHLIKRPVIDQRSALASAKNLRVINSFGYVAGAILLACAVMLFLISARDVKARSNKHYVSAILLCCIVALLCVCAVSMHVRSQHFIVVTSPAVTTHLGPSALASPTGALHSGDCLSKHNSYRGWYKIKDTTGTVGWVSFKDAESL